MSFLSTTHFFFRCAGQRMCGAANGVIHLTAACGRRWKTMPAQNCCGSSCWSRKSRHRGAPVRVRLRVGVRVRVRVSVSPLTLTLTLTLSLTPILTLTRRGCRAPRRLRARRWSTRCASRSSSSRAARPPRSTGSPNPLDPSPYLHPNPYPDPNPDPDPNPNPNPSLPPTRW